MIHNPFNCHTEVKAWAGFLKNIRHFFDSRGFFEVSTPALVPYGSFESTIDPLQVNFSSGKGELHTSPEIQMKGLLAQSPLPIYQICKCFRDDPASDVHAIEFTMLEYYRPVPDYTLIQNDMKDLLSALAGRTLNFKEYASFEIIKELTSLDLAKLSTVEKLREAITKQKVLLLSEEDSWEDMFFKLMLEKVEPSLPREIPVLIKDYPLLVSPLSQKKEGTTLAERFEIYWQGMEICNGCVELTDSDQLKQRYTYESNARIKAGKKPHPVPTLLFEAADHMPSSAGVAVGLERLYACIK